jgi:hypothetical protein
MRKEKCSRSAPARAFGLAMGMTDDLDCQFEITHADQIK